VVRDARARDAAADDHDAGRVRRTLVAAAHGCDISHP
jgi:hypothetical protein